MLACYPTFKDEECHLLYARNLEKLGLEEDAIIEFEVLVDYASSPAPAYHYALLCRKLGKNDKALSLLQSIISKSNTLGHHYNTLHGEWIKLAKRAL